MNRRTTLICILALILGFYGCKQEQPRETVCLLDISKSITPDSVRYEFKLMDELVDRMHRGDRLVIIPITDSAVSETPGHVLSFTAPTSRQPYDHDLVVFRQQAHGRVHKMRDVAIAHPSERTDIFGALDVAKQEFDVGSSENSPKHFRKTLIVLSDFLEDDGTYRFVSDRSMTTDEGAVLLAQRFQSKHDYGIDNVRIYAGGLGSADLRNLPPQRQQAIRTFWKQSLAPIWNPQIIESIASQ